MKDLMGHAIWDYYYQENSEDLQTETSISELDDLPVSYLFRDYQEMNALEKKALDLSFGKVLDVGSGAGSHSLYLQNERKLEVTALDISPKSIEVCKARGIKNAICEDLLQFSEKDFDTILLLMNGTGIFQSLEHIDQYLQKLKSLVADNGQILLDSTDILYMYDQDEDGGVLVPATGYYGELDYYLHYKGESEEPMKWLYLDFDTLENAAIANGFKIQKIEKLEDSYLAQLTLK
ncbi:methyltransferase domain-containing protein [Cloacibacterium normanense]